MVLGKIHGTRERKRQETLRRITDAGVKLFSTKGYDETTLDEVAAAAGISRRTFFHYFKSKDDILLSLQRGMGVDVQWLSPEDAAVLAERREVAEFFEACVARGGAPKSASLWVRMDLLRLSREEGVPLTSLPVLPDDVVALGELTESKELSATAAKAVLDRMVRDRCSLEEARKRTGIGGRLAGEALSAPLPAPIHPRAAVGPAESVLTMSGNQNVCAGVYALTLALNIALSVVLIPMYGLWGAAIATAASMPSAESWRATPTSKMAAG